MIATHNPKTLNSKLKQAPISAIVPPAHPHFLHSGNVNGRELFAASSAQYIKQARELADSAESVEVSIPQPTDGKIKQLLLPYLDDYIALSPVPSLKIMDELYERSIELRTLRQQPYLYTKKAIIQDSAVASNNHGDPVAAHGGKLFVVHQKIFPVKKPEKLLTFPKNGVLITADVQGLLVSSNYVQSGIPAITAIGGAVHVLERETGQKLNFAVGFGSTADTIHQIAKKSGTVKAGKYTIDLCTEETTTNAMVYIFVATDNPEPVQAAAHKIKRIAGGTAWNITADHVTTNDHIPVVRWLNPFSVNPAPHADVLYAYIEQKRAEPATTAIVQNGYVMLHEPFHHPYSRADSKLFAWAEPVHCMCSVEYAIKTLWQLKTVGNFLCWWAV